MTGQGYLISILGGWLFSVWDEQAVRDLVERTGPDLIDGDLRSGFILWVRSADGRSRLAPAVFTPVKGSPRRAAPKAPGPDPARTAPAGPADADPDAVSPAVRAAAHTG